MSAATVHADLRAAVRAILTAAPGLPAAFSWEGEAFTPTLGTPWLRERMSPVGSPVRGLGVGGAIAHRVVFNLTPFHPAGQGTLAIEAAAGALLDAFRPTTALVSGPTAGTVVQAERAALIHEPSWVSCPVAITVLAYTAG